MVTIRVGDAYMAAERVKGGYVIRDSRRAGDYVAEDEVEVVG